MANSNIHRRSYAYNGSAAYDVYRNSAAPQVERPGLPEERRQPLKKTRVKVKTAVSPFAIVGMLAAGWMLILVVFGYVQLYEITSEVGRLQSQLNTLTAEQANLETVYEGKIDLAYIEQRAAELNMQQPGNGQVVYLNLAGSDRAEIFLEEKSSPVSEVLQAIRNSVTELVEYLS